MMPVRFDAVGWRASEAYVLSRAPAVAGPPEICVLVSASPSVEGVGSTRLEARVCCDPAVPAGFPGILIVVMMRGSSSTMTLCAW